MIDRIPFYETVMEHQQSAVLQYHHKPDGTHLWHMSAADEVFGSEMEAIHLLPFVKLGVDIALARQPEYHVDVTEEYFNASAGAKAEDYRLRVATVSSAMMMNQTDANARPMGM